VSIAVGRSDLITREGYQRLQAKLEQLVTERRAEVARWLRDAREDGGEPAENVDLSEVLHEQALLERQIAELEYRLAAARIVEPAADGTAGIGTVVRLRGPRGVTSVYQLVGPLEADATRRRLSIDAPVGKALLGRVAGDVVEVDAPKGLRRFEIISVDAPAQEAA
jgi:transcription elongation factor GreA